MGALLFVAFLVAACGEAQDADEADGSADSRLAVAAEKTEDADSVRITSKTSIESPAVTSEDGVLVIEGEGVFDFEEQRSRMIYDLSDVAAEEGLSGDEETIEFVSDGLVYYVRAPLLKEEFGVDTPWISYDLGAVRSELGLGQLAQVNDADPIQMLNFMRGHSSGVEEVGGEDVRGIEAIRYRFTVDLDSIVEQAPEDVQEQLRRELAGLEEMLGTNELPAEVWIDNRGLVRRWAWQIDFTDSGSDEGGRYRREMDLFDYGVDVAIEVPPARQVTDVTELARNGGR